MHRCWWFIRNSASALLGIYLLQMQLLGFRLKLSCISLICRTFFFIFDVLEGTFGSVMSAEGNVSVVDSTILWFVESLPSFLALALFSDFGCATLVISWLRFSTIIYFSILFWIITDALSCYQQMECRRARSCWAVAVDPVGILVCCCSCTIKFVVLSAGVALSVSVTGLSVVRVSWFYFWFTSYIVIHCRTVCWCIYTQNCY